MRALAILAGFIGAIAGAFGAYTFIRAVGPSDRSNDYGYGNAAVAPPGGGTLLQTKNFKAVVAALHRELGPEARLMSLDVKWTEANAIAVQGDHSVYIDIDASGRSQSRINYDAASLGARTPLSRIDAAAIDRLVASAQEQNRAPVEEIQLDGSSRQWNIDMVRGEPDRLIANLDGSGVRLSGEPNPEPVGAAPDSLLLKANLEKVLAAAKKDAQGATKIVDFDIRPDRASFTLDRGTRELELDYGYDAQLTSRNISAKTGAPEQGSVTFDQIDTAALDRMARSKQVKSLGNVQYVLLSQPAFDGDKVGLSMYLTSGSDPGYVMADLHGRHVTWPGKQ